MRIRRLKLSGFKSFVDSAELRIEAGLTGVVGPNGCWSPAKAKFCSTDATCARGMWR